MAGNETGVDVARNECRMSRHTLQKLDVIGETDDRIFVERQCQPLQRLLATLTMHNELGNHRVIVRRDGVALAHTGVDAHIGIERRRSQQIDHAQRRQKLIARIFGVHPRLKGMAVDA